MRKITTYFPEVRERAVRMVLGQLNDYPSEWVHELLKVNEILHLASECFAQAELGRRLKSCRHLSINIVTVPESHLESQNEKSRSY